MEKLIMHGYEPKRFVKKIQQSATLILKSIRIEANRWKFSSAKRKLCNLE